MIYIIIKMDQFADSFTGLTHEAKKILNPSIK